MGDRQISEREGDGAVVDTATWRWEYLGSALINLTPSVFSCCCAPLISVAFGQQIFFSPLL
jgi:hypothetical protein